MVSETLDLLNKAVADFCKERGQIMARSLIAATRIDDAKGNVDFATRQEQEKRALYNQRIREHQLLTDQQDLNLEPSIALEEQISLAVGRMAAAKAELEKAEVVSQRAETRLGQAQDEFHAVGISIRSINAKIEDLNAQIGQRARLSR